MTIKGNGNGTLTMSNWIFYITLFTALIAVSSGSYAMSRQYTDLKCETIETQLENLNSAMANQNAIITATNASITITNASILSMKDQLNLIERIATGKYEKQKE